MNCLEASFQSGSFVTVGITGTICCEVVVGITGTICCEAVVGITGTTIEESFSIAISFFGILNKFKLKFIVGIDAFVLNSLCGLIVVSCTGDGEDFGLSKGCIIVCCLGGESKYLLRSFFAKKHLTRNLETPIEM